jgi:hypothetical protein
MKQLIWMVLLWSAASLLSACGSVNYPPGKAYIEPGAGDAF